MPINDPNPEAPSYMRKVTNYAGSKGERIEEMRLCHLSGSVMTDGERIISNIEEPLVRYIGVVASLTPVISPTGDGNMLMSQVVSEIRFEIEADNIDSAFRNYSKSVQDVDEAMQKEQEKMMKNMEEEARKSSEEEASRLVVPNAVESQQINEDLKLIRP